MKTLSFILLFLWVSFAFAQSGGIPTKYMNDPAVDLVRNGKLLMPDEVDRLRTESHGRLDISTLDPEEKSDLWKNVYLKTLPAEANPLGDMDEVTYNSPVVSPSGIFRFNVQNKLGDGKLYTMMLSKTVHTFLLAKSLLRKIGYQIPDIKYLPRVVVKFKSKAEIAVFKSYLENIAFAGAAQYWVIDELDDNKLVLQDLVIMESDHSVYNLAVGVTPEMIQGRRLLSSLAVPLSIVNLTESVNMLRWNAGVKTNNEIVLFHDNLEDFQCTWDDGRWISRRIETLTRDDWKEIVTSTHLPKPVQMILLEKIISRRNSVMKLFKIDAEELRVDSEINDGVDLVKGKLTREEWPGFAARFAYGDPDSPLATSEMHSWFKSRAISTMLDLTMGQINQLKFMGTDIEKINSDTFQKYIAEAATKAQQTNTPFVVPLKEWAFPTVRGQIILSRNLVTGTYLGTDNLVQLVDTIGVAVGGGVFVGTMGLPSPLKVYANAEAMLVRSYSHLRPVTSIQKSLKYPYKNIIVPLVKMDYGSKLHEATKVVLDPKATDKEKEEKLAAAMKPFKDNMDVGESLLITDTLTTQANLQASAGYQKLVSASLGFNPSHAVVSRFHVHRRSADEFQIYRDLGHEGSFGVEFDLNSLIPVIKLKWKASGGHSKVKFYTLNTNPKNPDVVKNLGILRRAIVSQSTAHLDKDEKYAPYVLKTAFRESTPEIGLFFWQWQWENSTSDITVTNPKGDTRYFTRTYKGQDHGKNYQAYVNAMISHWVQLIWKKRSGLTDSTGSNPGYSFKGVAENKVLTLDVEVDKTGKPIEPFVRVSRVFNGWSIDRKKAQEILDHMKQRYRFEFFNAPVLNDTRRIFLYNISVNLLFYKRGIENLMTLKDDQIKKIFKENHSQKDLTVNPANLSDDDSGANKFIRFLSRFKKYESEGKEAKANKYLLKSFELAEDQLNIPGLSLLVGGEENLYLTSKIDGFREGDEDGDRSIVSSTLGEYGSAHLMGPISALQQSTNMLEGEFFIYWMMTRLI